MSNMQIVSVCGREEKKNGKMGKKNRTTADPSVFRTRRNHSTAPCPTPENLFLRCRRDLL